MTGRLDLKRINFWLLIVLLGFIYRILTVPPPEPFPPDPRIDSTPLLLGEAAADLGPREIGINEPVELDHKSRAEIFEIRKRYVLKYPQLIAGGYSPSLALFGQITDGKPWWGLDGQYCKGAGMPSIDGPSEETRFLANPFILLNVDEAAIWIIPENCFPVYPRPVSLVWDAPNKKATVTYDMSRYWEEWQRVKPRHFGPSYQLVDYNARDFGYSYLAVSKKDSRNVLPYGKAKMFDQPIYLQAYIHTGGSCGYPGGCNNQSPWEPDLNFWVKRAPAEMHCKLWRHRPRSVNDREDFLFVIKFE